MGKEYTQIDHRIQTWIDRQKMFFVATAPLSGEGRVNCSPKGLDTFRVLGPRETAYLHPGGSGIETVAHVRENQRIVIMMCSFEGPPKIFRFYGKGSVLEPGDDGFDELLERFAPQPAARNIVRVSLSHIIDSCGYGVPLYEFRGHRESLKNYFDKQTEEEILEYRRTRNKRSLDGLPGLDGSSN
jgi:hypothetical protein